MGLDDLSSLKCFVTWSIAWFLGFTLVLCWSIWQLPDAGGCGIKAAWVPDAFCREACLIPLCPVVFALPSIFWPVTLVVLATREIERRCGMPFAYVAKLASIGDHEMKEIQKLLPDEERCLGFEEHGGIQMDDLSDDSRSSEAREGPPRLPYHMRVARAIRKECSSRFRSISVPYQPIPPATF